MRINQNIFKSFFIIPLMMTAMLSCKKLVEINSPTNQLTTDKVFINDNSAMSVLLSVYNQLSVTASIESNISPVMGIYADELITTTASRKVYQNNAVPPTDNLLQTVWPGLYNAIYQSNALIEAMQKVTSVTDSAKHQITGEAKFLRALSYFYLTNLWGNVPLVTSTDASSNSLQKQSTVSDIYSQIEKDLLDAQNLLPGSFIYGERIRASKMSATALLSRIYCYQKKWPEAITQSSMLIQQSGVLLLDSLKNTFIKNSHESILQLWRQNGFSAVGPIYIPAGAEQPAYPLTSTLLNTFEPGDQRKTSWMKPTTVSGIVYYYPYKYKKRAISQGSDAEYTMLFRLGEQYLIRAESYINSNNLSAAIADLNQIRTRAGLTALNNTYTQIQLLSLMQQERLTELFSEWGHRFFDLKRWGLLDQVLSVSKPQWKSTAALLPIPQAEINKNQFLVQNPGY